MQYALGADIWALIAGMCTVRDQVRLAATCKWMRLKLGSAHTEWKSLTADEGLVAAATIGDIELVRAFASRATHRGWALYRALRWGYTEVAEYLRWRDLPMMNSVNVHGTKTTEYVYESLSNFAHIVTYQYNNVNGAPFVQWSVFSDAATHGDLEALQSAEYIIAGLPSSNCQQIFDFAAAADHVHIIKWGCESKYEKINNCALNAVGAAAAYGRTDLLRWYRANTAAEFTTICYWGSRCGHISVLEFAIEAGMSFNPFGVCDSAISYNHPHMIRWIASKGMLPASRALISRAKKHKRRDIVALLNELMQ